MVASVSSPEDVVNIALREIGHPRRVSNMFDGSMGAKAMLDVYAQTRDAMLRQVAPEFSRKAVTLTLLKSAPAGGYVNTPWTNAYPIPPYAYEYVYPTDCLRILYPVPTNVPVPNNNPLPILFTPAFDNSERVILSNQAGLTLTYVGQITDPTTWDVDFVETVAHALARRLTVALTSNQQIVDFLKTQELMEEKAVAGAGERAET